MIEGEGAANARTLQERGLERWYQPGGWTRGWLAAIPLPATATLCEGLGAPVHKEFELGTLAPGEVPLHVETEGRWPAEMQFLNWHWLVAMDAELASALLAAIFEHYPEIERTYDFLPPSERATCLPALTSADGLRPLVALTGIVLHAVPHASTPYLGAMFRCAWDEEHGLGVLLHGTTALEVGTCDVALDGERAREHRAAFLANLPPPTG